MSTCKHYLQLLFEYKNPRENLERKWCVAQYKNQEQLDESLLNERFDDEIKKFVSQFLVGGNTEDVKVVSWYSSSSMGKIGDLIIM